MLQEKHKKKFRLIALCKIQTSAPPQIHRSIVTHDNGNSNYSLIVVFRFLQSACAQWGNAVYNNKSMAVEVKVEAHTVSSFSAVGLFFGFLVRDTLTKL